MDQKHAMLYPELQPNSAATQNQRDLASTAMGLPTDSHVEPPPPSYDMAVSAAGTVIANEPHRNDTWLQHETFYGANDGNASQNITRSPQFPRNEAATRSFVEPNIPQQQQQQQQQQSVTVLNQQHMPKLGPHPCTVFCPACGTSRTSRMAYTPNTRTHFCALLLCLVGWCCCACLVPYCTNSCRTGNHYCATCNTFLGTYELHEST